MNPKTKKRRNILLAVVAFIFISPLIIIKGNISTSIDVEKQLNDTIIENKTRIYKTIFTHTGIEIGSRQRFIEGLESLNSTSLNLGVYTKITFYMSYTRKVDGNTHSMDVKSTSYVWGMGNILSRKNIVFQNIDKTVNQLFLELN